MANRGPKLEELLKEYFDGDDPDWVTGTCEGAWNVTPPPKPSHSYMEGYVYGQVMLVFENPTLWHELFMARPEDVPDTASEEEE